MTPEQIEDLREMQAAVPPGVEVGTWRLDPDTFDALLAAAERALVLEDVLSAATAYRNAQRALEDIDSGEENVNGAMDWAVAKEGELFAAIDRAEGK